jgi:hypothetical protein
MIDWIRDKWEGLNDAQRIVAAVLLLVLGYVCLFCLNFACGWAIVLRWVSDVLSWSTW